MNKFKRLSALVTALVLSASMLTACSGNKDDSKTETQLTTSMKDSAGNMGSSGINYDQLVIPANKLVIDGKEVDTTDLVVMTINGEYKISFDEYRFFYFTAVNEAGFDFSLLEKEDIPEAYKLVKDYVENYIKRFYADFVLAKENGIEITEDVENEVEVTYQQYLAEYDGEENFEKLLLSQYYTVDVWKKLCVGQILYYDAYEALYGEEGTYFVSEDEFKEFAKTDDYARVKHILVTFASQAELSEKDMEGYDELTLSKKLSLKESAYANLDEEGKKAVDAKAKELIDEILVKVNNGEDFDKLMKEYGWDPGMESSPDGYCITPNTSFVEEFITATFELEAGKTSGIVESDYGYHILKREVVDDDFIEKNLEDLYNDYYSEVIANKENELRTEIIDKMEITYCDEYSKFAYDSIS